MGFVILNEVTQSVLRKNLNFFQQEPYRLSRNGTSRVPYEKMASPERDIPCCAGTGLRSLREDGFAGTDII